MSKKILILGINGFIGSNLTSYILKNTDWGIIGFDLSANKLGDDLHHPRLQFKQGDVFKDKNWIEAQVQACDVVLPLVAVANPSIYVEKPLFVFQLDFESNLEIVKLCHQHKKRIVFPSTSEVYGMCPDKAFDEENSVLVTGPINKERWIYSCAKQMLDRVIYAYGKHHGLDFSLFRPFNWIGPKQDQVFGDIGKVRVVALFLHNILYRKPITLVNDGLQQRSFTYIDDGIEALVKIIENKNECATQRIFNIGNPNNQASIKQIAEMILNIVKTYPKFKALAEQAKIITQSGADFYGSGYQDVDLRVPSIKNAETYLNWKPLTNTQSALEKTIHYYLTAPEFSAAREIL